jgi:hypothetical protein
MCIRWIGEAVFVDPAVGREESVDEFLRLDGLRFALLLGVGVHASLPTSSARARKSRLWALCVPL